MKDKGNSKKVKYDEEKLAIEQFFFNYVQTLDKNESSSLKKEIINLCHNLNCNHICINL